MQEHLELADGDAGSESLEELLGQEITSSLLSNFVSFLEGAIRVCTSVGSTLVMTVFMLGF